MKLLKENKVIITFLGNANQDSRVVNLIESLLNLNYKVQTISFDWKTENFKSQIGKTNIYILDKSKSSLKFYFTFFYLLTKDLLKFKADIYFTEDVYTLPLTYLFAKYNKAKIFYNSREIYANLGALRNKSFTQNVITKIEQKFIKKVDYVLVTGEMDKNYLKEFYKLNNILVIRNLPKYTEKISKIDLRTKYEIPYDKSILIYQGVILEGRGILKLIKLMNKIDNAYFIIIGDGEFKKQFEEETQKLNLKSKVHFIGAVNHSELLSYTASADIGVALIENISLSYYYALPNKLFEYIMAGVPVLCSDLPQMKNIIDEYKVGRYVNAEDEDEIISILKEMLIEKERFNYFKINCYKAAKELNWEFEFDKVKELLLN